MAITPIGNSSTKFSGSFDGQGFLINRLTLNLPTTDFVGLFGQTEFGSTIQNVGLKNASIIGQDFTGTLIGNSASSVSKCFSSGSVQGHYYVGGLIGTSLGTLSESYSLGSTTGTAYTGGLVGYLHSSQVTHSFSKSTVTSTGGPNYVSFGGLVGFGLGSIVQNSYSTGDIFAFDGFAGGLVGKLSTGSQVLYSFTDGSIYNGSMLLSSLLSPKDGSSSISNSYFNSNNTCTNSCTNSGAEVQSDGSIGVAVNSNYFYDKNNPPLNHVSWDFSTIWQENGSDYPSLLRTPANY